MQSKESRMQSVETRAQSLESRVESKVALPLASLTCGQLVGNLELRSSCSQEAAADSPASRKTPSEGAPTLPHFALA